jgi:hypothetical protein
MGCSLARVRASVDRSGGGIDLAERKQMVVVTDHDSRVLARKTFRCRAWDLGTALDWARERAIAKGFAGVTVSCEPTGHRSCAGPAGRGSVDGVGVCAAVGQFLVAAHRRPDAGQDR